MMILLKELWIKFSGKYFTVKAKKTQPITHDLLWILTYIIANSKEIDSANHFILLFYFRNVVENLSTNLSLWLEIKYANIHRMPRGSPQGLLIEGRQQTRVEEIEGCAVDLLINSRVIDSRELLLRSQSKIKHAI